MDKGTSVKLDKSRYDELVQIRKTIGIPVAVSIRNAIDEYLKKFNSSIIAKATVGLDDLDSADTVHQKPESS